MFPHSNGLISQLSEPDQALLIRSARLAELKAGDLLTAQQPELPAIYFLGSGSVALFVGTPMNAAHTGLAVGLIGRTGAVNLQAAMGLGIGNITPMVQSAGFAYVIESVKLQGLMKRRPHWRLVFSNALWRNYQDIARLAALSHTQDIKIRLANWLLMSMACCQPEPLRMTHEHMAQMLGVRRASITLAAKEMKNLGLIDYRRGHIQFLNALALTHMAS